MDASCSQSNHSLHKTAFFLLLHSCCYGSHSCKARLVRVALVAAAYRAHQRRRRVRRRWWVHPILRTRLQRGEYHVLVQELRLDAFRFELHFRMSPEDLDQLLCKVGPHHLKLSVCHWPWRATRHLPAVRILINDHTFHARIPFYSCVDIAFPSSAMCALNGSFPNCGDKNTQL